MLETHIGFTGNRYGLTQEQKTQIIQVFELYDDIIVSHGDCVGSDTDFHNLSIEYKQSNPTKKFLIHIYPPTDNKLRSYCVGDLIFDPKPYLQRNKNIVTNSDILIGCPIDKTKEQIRSGTWSTIRFARKLNKQIYLL
jgi:hypothetical protein